MVRKLVLSPLFEAVSNGTYRVPVIALGVLSRAIPADESIGDILSRFLRVF